MDELKIFKKAEFGQVRIIVVDGEPWFVGKDVGEILGYSNTKDAISSHVDNEDRRIIQRSENTTFDIPNRGMTVINESGLYSLVLSSKLPTAKKFKRWVTGEVLPAIRKHGMYAVDELINDPDLLIQVATELKIERQKRRAVEEERERLRQELDVSKDWYSIKRVAAMNGVKWKTYHKVVWEAAYPKYEI